MAPNLAAWECLYPPSNSLSGSWSPKTVHHVGKLCITSESLKSSFYLAHVRCYFETEAQQAE